MRYKHGVYSIHSPISAATGTIRPMPGCLHLIGTAILPLRTVTTTLGFAGSMSNAQSLKTRKIIGICRDLAIKLLYSLEKIL